MVAVRPNATKVYPYYLFAILRSSIVQTQIENMHVGTLIPHFKKGDFDKLLLPIPKPKYQQAIGDIYMAFSRKIELNRRMNDTLEATAKALFKSWFVDFDPVRAKAEGRSPEGLAPDIAALFPDGFEGSELGEIPRGWEASPMTTVIEVNPKRILPKGSDAPYIEMANLPTNSSSVTEWRYRVFTSGSKFMNGDTLLARITPCLENGKTAFVDDLPSDTVGWGSTEFIVLRAIPPFPLEFSYLLARSSTFRDFAITNMTGSSGRQRVPDSCLSNFWIAEPPDGLLKAFGELMDPIFSKIRAAHHESKTLGGIRDILLPKLISGELRVRDVETLVEAAL